MIINCRLRGRRFSASFASDHKTLSGIGEEFDAIPSSEAQQLRKRGMLLFVESTNIPHLRHHNFTGSVYS